jgi:hypothetical protein
MMELMLMIDPPPGHSVFVLGVSMFYVMLLQQSFFGSGNYSIFGPYVGELWPGRLRGSGMGFVYGIGNSARLSPGGAGADRRLFQLRQAGSDARCVDRGIRLLRLLVHARRLCLLVHRL